MLEDPTHNNIVRWSQTGDSFIVVDTNDFTKNILPQHFKHSNFASFVRQLNKYDFHKIKNTEESGGGEGWQFKHPEFTKDSKDNLDNIRRKAPASRKQQQQQFDDAGSQQIEQLTEGYRQIRDAQRSLEDRFMKQDSQYNGMYADLQLAYQSQQMYIHHHEEIIKRLLSVLSDLSNQVRALQRINGHNASSHREDGVSPGETGDMGSAATSPATNHQGNSTPLQEAQRLMEGYRGVPRPSMSIGMDLEQLGHHEGNDGGFDGTYPQNGTMMGPLNGAHAVQNVDHQQGQHMFVNSSFNNGHAGWNNTPPPAPNNGMTGRPAPARKKSTPNTPHWKRAPQVLLVEDDPTCRRIGSKFLLSAQCEVDVADDGLIAVNKMNHSRKYDLVLMDIMMPNLDGVSAAALIRQFNTDTPIVAMTSNIRRDDINTYFDNGMNDVLPKPFTKEGLLGMLEQQLKHLTLPRNDGGAFAANSRHAHPTHLAPHLSFPTHDEAHGGHHPAHGAHPGHPGQSGGNSLNSNMKYSVSPGPSKSPFAAHGNQRSPEGMSEDASPNVQQQAGMDDPGGYIGMMGGYLPEEQGGYHSPANPGHRRGPEEEIYGVQIKKQRF
ncbi:hypothetical protein BZA77DRAFT_93264 [Pyronema omphalodes]|nr:hypothetical protein BZA77DRAFT_93264 [Pyronema omphalodes]